MNVWRLKDCNKCGGDLFHQDGEWGCLQCGRYYYPKAEPSVAYPQLDAVAVGGGNDTRRTRRRSGGLAGRNINAMIDSQLARTRRWQDQNKQSIASLDAGRTVAETARALGEDPRRMRSVAERLREMKTLELEPAR